MTPSHQRSVTIPTAAAATQAAATAIVPTADLIWAPAPLTFLVQHIQPLPRCASVAPEP